MQTNISSAQYVSDSNDPDFGTIRITLDNAVSMGFINNVALYQDPNVLSVPNDVNPAELHVQSAAQMRMGGVRPSIQDTNFEISPGEWTSYTNNWYVNNRHSGVEIQQAQSSNKENMMMGQSTNEVLLDIVQALIALYDWAETHTHTGGTISGNTGTPIEPIPDDSAIVNDETYIQDNKNLAITGTYEPH